MAKSPSAIANIEQEIKDTSARADLYEARARLAVAQAEIAKAHCDRKRSVMELEALNQKKK